MKWVKVRGARWSRCDPILVRTKLSLLISIVCPTPKSRPRVLTKMPNPSRANRSCRPIHRRSLAFRQRPLFDQHHTRPAPRGVRLPCDEKASSGLPLQPTDLPLLLTEQIAHLRPFPIVFAWEIAREAKTPQTRHAGFRLPQHNAIVGAIQRSYRVCRLKPKSPSRSSARRLLTRAG